MQGPENRVQSIRVVRRPGSATGGLLIVGGTVIACRLGRSGIGRFKREGDGKTPAGRYALIDVLYRADKGLPPGRTLAARLISADLGWSDDVADGRYNRPVRLPFRGSHEVMRRGDHLYDLVGILDWNVTRRSIGRGSAIFLHYARDDGRPTEGCIALSRKDMPRLLARLRRGAVFRVG